MRILFVGANRIGDAVIMSGVLDHLIRTYPDCRITIACGPAAADVFARMPNRERTILFPKRRFDLHWLDLWRQVAFTCWDLVVDLRGSGLAWFVRTRRRAVHSPRRMRMYEQYAAALGVHPAPLPVAWTAPADRAKAAALLPAGRRVVVLGPTANSAYKVWPAGRFAALFRALAAGPLPGAVPVVLAGPAETERAGAAPLLALLPEAIDACGKLSLPEAAAVIGRCDLYVGNDSGLMHMAAACGVPTIGLCGATLDRAEEMAPTGLRAAWAIGRDDTMTGLSVEAALAACERLLGQVAMETAPLPVA
jgi:heptosyltransferase III